MRWTTIMTVCILKTFRHKLTAPGFGCTKSLRVFLKLRGVTRSDGALSPPTTAPEIIAAGSMARLSPAPEVGLEVAVISHIIDEWILL
jgi:hypothetical protein